MTTARDIVTGSLKLLGVLFKGEVPDADEASDGLVILNEILDSWSNESLLCYGRIWENFSLVGGTGQYSIGTSQTFNTARPIQIISGYTRLTGSNVDHPLSLINDDDYALTLIQKSIQATWPAFMNYDNLFPNANIRLWPVPNASGTIYLQSEKQITSFATLDTAVSLPPGWVKALKYQLASDSAPEYGEPAIQSASGPLFVEEKKASKGAIKSAVLKNRPMTYQKGTPYKGYDVLSDQGA